MALLYKADPVRGQHWQALFAEHAPDIEWRAWPDIGNPDDIEYLAAWQAPDDLQRVLPNLKVLFALSAGVDQLDLSRLPPELPVVRLLDPGITRGMCEYASWAVLSLHRDMLRYRQQQVARCWQAHLLQPAVSRRVGVLGLGTQAQQILPCRAGRAVPISWRAWTATRARRNCRRFSASATFCCACCH